jgi:hypothetical protein
VGNHDEVYPEGQMEMACPQYSPFVRDLNLFVSSAGIFLEQEKGADSVCIRLTPM